jgi:hypothetical protein
MSNSSSPIIITFSPTAVQSQPKTSIPTFLSNEFTISPAQLQSMMPLASSLSVNTLSPTLQQKVTPPTPSPLNSITFSPADQQLLSSMIPTPVSLFNISVPPAFQLPTDTSTSNSSSNDEVTLPPGIQDQINSVIPNFPITFDVAFNDSWYSVEVTVKPQGSICAAGYICNKTHQASCLDIQEAAITEFRFGDIHGGAYCPDDSPYYLNCPIGYYCPNAVSLLSDIYTYFYIHTIVSLLFYHDIKLSRQSKLSVRQASFAPTKPDTLR